MRNSKKLLIVFFLFIATITITSCRKQNKEVPYGSITDAVYVSNGSYSVTQKQVYDNLRTKGYSYVTQKINELLLVDYMNKVSYSGDNKEKLDELIISAIFSTTDAKSIKELPDKEKKNYKQKYVDNLLTTYGVKVSVDDVNFTIVDDEIEGEFPEAIWSLYKYEVASKAFAREKLNDIVKLEKIDDEDNPYYITEAAIKAQYKIMTGYSTRKTIIITFSSKRNADLAMAYMAKLYPQGVTEENKISYYIDLYNYQYDYLDALTLENYLDSDEITYVHDKDKNELTALNSSINVFFEALEDGEYTKVPKNIDDTYTMILRISEEKPYEEENYNNLTGTVKEEVDKEIYEILIENKISYSFINEEIVKMLEDATIEIYDPLIEFNYAKYNEDYTYTKNFDNNLIFKIYYESKELTLSVTDFYNHLNKIHGVNVAVDYLIAQMLVGNTRLVERLYLDNSDADKTFSETYESSLKEFKNSDDKDFGVENYLLSTYGYKTKNDVLEYYYKANALKSIAAKDMGTLIDADSNFIKEGTIFDIFYQYTKDLYENFFSLDIEHILITIDIDNDGNPDDPKKFIEKLEAIDPNKAREFENNIASLAYAIVKETDYISTSTFVALTHIQKAYNLGLPILSIDPTGNTTWDDYKWNYNISLVVESLGTVDNAKATSFVTTFSERVKELYEVLKDDKDFDSDEGYLEHTDKAENELTIDDLTYTNYGYHILNVTSVATKSTAKYSYEDDSLLDSNDQYKRYERIEVIIDEMDPEDDDDDIIGYTDAYSPEGYPSTQQLFIYFFEYRSGDVTSFRSTIETAISKVFDTYISRFTGSDFQTYRLYQSLGTLAFADSSFNGHYASFLQIKERSIDAYADTNLDTNPFYAFTDWFTHDWSLEK